MWRTKRMRIITFEPQYGHRTRSKKQTLLRPTGLETIVSSRMVRHEFSLFEHGHCVSASGSSSLTDLGLKTGESPSMWATRAFCHVSGSFILIYKTWKEWGWCLVLWPNTFFIRHIPVEPHSWKAGSLLQLYSWTTQYDLCVLIYYAILNWHAANRDIFYKDPGLFIRQANVDCYIDDLALTFGVRREALNVVGTTYRDGRCISPLNYPPVDCRGERSRRWGYIPISCRWWYAWHF